MISDHITFTIDHQPDDGDVNHLLQRLIEFNLKHLETIERKPLAVWFKSETGELMAGITGNTFGNWLEIRLFWVSEHLRGTGIGRQMLAQMESAGKSRGCKYAFLDTFDFQAKPFYEKNGYREVFCLDEYPLQGKKHFLLKRLQSL